MAKNREMLKEAIAEAKAVKERSLHTSIKINVIFKTSRNGGNG